MRDTYQRGNKLSRSEMMDLNEAALVQEVDVEYLYDLALRAKGYGGGDPEEARDELIECGVTMD